MQEFGPESTVITTPKGLKSKQIARVPHP